MLINRVMVLLVLSAPLVFIGPPNGSSSAANPTGQPNTATAEGLILQAQEGERRVRRPAPSTATTLEVPFIIKVDGTNGGSPDFFMGYEDIPPGKGIARHYHPHYDEILFVHRGSGVASLGSREAAVREGATIYIRPNTRVSL